MPSAGLHGTCTHLHIHTYRFCLMFLVDPLHYNPVSQPGRYSFFIRQALQKTGITKLNNRTHEANKQTNKPTCDS